MKRTYAMLLAIAVGITWYLHHWLTRAAWIADFDPIDRTYTGITTGWHVLLEVWPLTLLGVIVGSIIWVGICVFSNATFEQITFQRQQAILQAQLDEARVELITEQQRTQTADERARKTVEVEHQAAIEEQLRARETRTWAEQQVAALNVALGQEKAARARAEKRAQNAAAGFQRMKGKRSVENSPAHTPR